MARIKPTKRYQSSNLLHNCFKDMLILNWWFLESFVCPFNTLLLYGIKITLNVFCSVSCRQIFLKIFSVFLLLLSSSVFVLKQLCSESQPKSPKLPGLTLAPFKSLRKINRIHDIAKMLGKKLILIDVADFPSLWWNIIFSYFVGRFNPAGRFKMRLCDHAANESRWWAVFDKAYEICASHKLTRSRKCVTGS